MKSVISSLVFLFTAFALFAQSEHYDTHPAFPHEPTPIEQQMLRTWYKTAKTSNPPTAPVTALAEFQSMGGVMISYPLGIPVQLVAELSLITKVKVLVHPASDSVTAKSYFAASGANMDNISCWVINHDSYWVRDYGPWFIVDGNDQLGIVDFTYNRPQRIHDDAALVSIAAKMNLDRFEMPMVHTGGNYMVDGYGTAASTDLVFEENPNCSESDLRSMAQNYLGIENYMFTNDPLGDYIAHIDCWGKFLDMDKVLIGQVPTSDSRYNDYEEAASTFANALTPWGGHYAVYRIYTPGGSYGHYTPYTNSLILNDHVFVPVTGNQWDDEAIETYQQAMPGYTIVPIMQTNNAIWENSDALHCRTHELADPNMLFVRHFPLSGALNLPSATVIEADIRALSGEQLIQDSLLVYYRVNAGSWQSAQMQLVGGSTYQALLTDLHQNDEVDYFISAQDVTGRVERHPYVGAAGPHHFSVHSVGISDRADLADKLVAYPNPCESQCVLQLSSGNIQNVTVYDVYGKVIFTSIYNNSKVMLNTQSWMPGVYTVKTVDESGNIRSVKVVRR